MLCFCLIRINSSGFCFIIRFSSFNLTRKLLHPHEPGKCFCYPRTVIPMNKNDPTVTEVEILA